VIAELGHFALIAAFVLAIAQALVPLLGASQREAGLIAARLMTVGRWLALLSAGLVLAAFAALVISFIRSDFSLALVAAHSHSAKPLIYKISGSWGNHEGSLLLWCVILALFGAIMARERRPEQPLPAHLLPAHLLQARLLQARAIAVQGMIQAAFLAFSLFTSNPFLRLAAPPLEGRGLNPVLQDPGLALHPPMLYLGYVGLSASFAFAVAGLIGGRIDRAWAAAMRPYVTLAWAALTCGIALGSWWAYYELGWGGWWFWDPVENASLMPWLAATALLHSVRVAEQREQLKSWTVLLAILGFSLSLLGTFIVRSGLLTSVHSFASDPARGLFILLLLGLAIGLPLLLFAWRGPQLAARADFPPLSREGALILNNILLVSASVIVLVGTFYPLALELVSGARITVGPPYFAASFNPVMALLVAAMGIGPLLVWRGGWRPRAGLTLLLAGGLALIGTGFFLLSNLLPGLQIGHKISPAGLAGIALMLWLGGSILADIGLRWRAGSWPKGRARRALSGMWLAHFGMVVFLAGALGEGLFGSEKIARLTPGDTVQLAGRLWQFDQVVQTNGPNWTARTARLSVQADPAGPARQMRPQIRFYPASQQSTTEAAIHSSVSGDDYAVLGEGSEERGYILRLYRKPLVGWIWFGSLLMALGGLLALSGRQKLPEAG